MSEIIPSNANASYNQFNLARDRDAYATIRGFFFQAERTMQRWIRLETGQILELECGEDIDIVGQALVGGDWQEERVLEQLKSREKNITLVSGREAIANFHEHRTSNQRQNLRFCLTTNATVGRENPPLFKKDKRTGIDLWRSLAKQELEEAESTGVLARIRQTLSQSAVPEGFNDETWQAFLEFADNGEEDEWLDFIDRFEWLTGVTAPLNLSQEIQNELLSMGVATDEATARAMYERLFVFVLRLLSQKGRKNLEAKGWEEIIKALPSGADQSLLAEALSQIDDLDQKVASIDVRLTEVESQVGGLVTGQSNLTMRVDVVETNQVAQTTTLSKIDSGQETANERLNELIASMADMQRTRTDEEILNSPQAQVLKVEIPIEEARQQLLEKGRFLMAQSRFEELRPLVASLTDDAARWRLESRLCGLRGFCCWRLGHFPKANELFAESFSLQPNNAKAGANAAYGALLVNKPEDALRLATKALEADEKSDDALGMAVKSLFLLEQKQDIEPLLEKHSEAARGIQTLFTRGEIAIETGDYQLAQELGIELCDLAPKNPMAHRLFFDAHFVPVQQQVLKDKPILMRLTKEQKDLAEKAEVAISRSIELMKDWDSCETKIDAYVARAGVRELLDKIDDAIEDCDELIGINPKNEKAHFIKGEMLLHWRGNYKEAISELQQVKSGDLADDARVLEAEALADLGKWDKVIKLLTPIYSPDASQREQMDLARLILQAAYKSNDAELVAKIKSDLETHYTDEVPALVTLSDLARWKEDYSSALSLLQNAYNLAEAPSKNRILYWIAQTQRLAGFYDDAVTNLEAIVDVTKPDFLLRAYLDALWSAGQKQTAAEIVSQLRNGGLAIAGFSEFEAMYADEQKDFVLAAQLCEQLSEDNPMDVLHAYNTANLLLRRFPPSVTPAAVQADPTLPDRIERARVALKRINIDAVKDNPRFMMDIAFMRKMVGFADAPDWAYRALRLSPGNGEIGGGYVQFISFMPPNDSRLDMEEVQAECAVEIKPKSASQETKSQIWIITNSPLGGEHEITPSHTLSQKVIGKRAGDTFVAEASSLSSNNEWEIVSVKSKYVHALQGTMQILSTVASHHSVVIGRFFTPEENAKQKRDIVRQLLDEGRSIEEIYENTPISVAGLAQITGRMVPDFWRAEYEKGGYTVEKAGRFHVASGQESEILQHRQIAFNATGLVLDWTSLISIVHLGAGNAIKTRYSRLIVPSVLAEEVKNYAARYDSSVSPLYEDDSGRRRREFINRLARFVQEQCEVIEISDWKDSDEEISKTYGRSTIAAIRLAAQEQIPLWSDDIRTRNLAKARYDALPSVGVQWLLLVLRAEKHISEDEYFGAIRKLMYSGYGFLWVTIPFVLWILRQNNMNVTDDVRRTLGYLPYWKVTESIAASLVAGVLVAVWKENLLEHRRRTLIDAILDALVEERPTYQTMQSLRDALNERLSLDVATNFQITQYIENWAKRQVQVIRGSGLIMPDKSIILPP